MAKGIEKRKNVVLIAPNGTGKTIMALSSVLPTAVRENKRIIFCARTFTQNQRVIDEAKIILKHLEKKGLPIKIGALSLRGRNELCPHKTIQRLKLPPRESMSICSSLRKNKNCKYFNNLIRNKNELKIDINYYSRVPSSAQDLLEKMAEREICPYFFSKILLKEIDLVVCNYQWVFEPNIRETFLEAMETTLSDCIIIMDECHNLPEMAANINSHKLTPYSLRQALKDLEIYRAKGHLMRVVKGLIDLFNNMRSSIRKEKGVDKASFLSYLLQKQKIGSLRQLKDLLLDLKEYGRAIQDEKIDSGLMGRDFITPISEFFNKLIEALDDPGYFLCFTVNEGTRGVNIALELKCLNPRFITDPIFMESYATLSLSGTLEASTYVSLLGLNVGVKDIVLLRMPTPFSRENIKVLVTDYLTTRGADRHDRMYKDILISLKPILLYTPKNVGVFCASYEVLEGLWKNGFKRLAAICNKKVFREDPENSAQDNDVMLEQYKAAVNDERYNGAVLLGVSGGRNSEGEDFPGDFMNTVVIVGVPFQRPTPSVQAMIDYYEQLFPKRGKHFAYITPALTRANQACGRPIRRMNDKGLIVLMDYRFYSLRKFLSPWIEENMKIIHHHPRVIEKEVKEFFEKFQK